MSSTSLDTMDHALRRLRRRCLVLVLTIRAELLGRSTRTQEDHRDQ